jgi:hypothetical protein
LAGGVTLVTHVTHIPTFNDFHRKQSLLNRETKIRFAGDRGIQIMFFPELNTSGKTRHTRHTRHRMRSLYPCEHIALAPGFSVQIDRKRGSVPNMATDATE